MIYEALVLVKALWVLCYNGIEKSSRIKTICYWRKLINMLAVIWVNNQQLIITKS